MMRFCEEKNVLLYYHKLARASEVSCCGWDAKPLLEEMSTKKVYVSQSGTSPFLESMLTRHLFLQQITPPLTSIDLICCSYSKTSIKRAPKYQII